MGDGSILPNPSLPSSMLHIMRFAAGIKPKVMEHGQLGLVVGGESKANHCDPQPL